uniref:Uncharacterized protein n=1 Tax=Psilocybe cubensis TaxID=181762 RepID=A0A8H8CID3_PSICU
MFTKRDRLKLFRKIKKKGEEHDTERISFYHIPSGMLYNRPIAKVYGSTNLYRDFSNPIDVDHLERQFSKLEQEASLAIKAIYRGIHQQMFTLSRKELATVRKFIFLMHFRNDAVSSTYFHENNPTNAPLVDWIRKYKETRQLKTDVDVWKDGLKYYLNTPHHEIVATGERLRERYGEFRLQEMLRKRLDPDIEEWYAIDYESLANYFFLGVWEAADDSDFVLSGNGFGLWEGLIYGSPGAHRLYVVSPRIVIVLRRTFLHQPHSNDPSILYSCLADIPIMPPNINYADPSAFENLDDSDPTLLRNIRDAYRCSEQAQKDQFTFRITKLSKAQTYAVNEVTMMNANLHPEGSLTFASPAAMLDTLQLYMASHNTFLGGKRRLFMPLVQQLVGLCCQDSSPTTQATLDFPWHADTDADRQLHMFLRFIVANSVSFPSSYNRAYIIYHMSTDIPSLSNPVSSKIREIQREAVQALRHILDPPLLPCAKSDSSLSPRNIVETLPNDESELFFSLVGHQMNHLQVGKYTNDILANIIYEASIIGVTHWIANNRPDVLFELVGNWATVVA